MLKLSTGSHRQSTDLCHYIHSNIHSNLKGHQRTLQRRLQFIQRNLTTIQTDHLPLLILRQGGKHSDILGINSVVQWTKCAMDSLEHLFAVRRTAIQSTVCYSKLLLLPKLIKFFSNSSAVPQTWFKRRQLDVESKNNQSWNSTKRFAISSS